MKKASIVLKFLVIICGIVGITLSAIYGQVKSYHVLMFFTVQSNVWIMFMDLIFLILIFMKKESPKLIKAYQVFVTCISLTGFVYCFILAPGYYLSSEKIPGFSPFNLYAVLLHIVVPVLSIIDYSFFTNKVKFKKFDFLYVFIPTLYYFSFASIGYFLNWDFGNGKNYPYFFLDYGSKAGFFGFSKEMPFMGNFYWFLIIILIIFGFSELFIKIRKAK